MAKVQLERKESGVAIIRLGAPDERVTTLTEERMNSFVAAIEELSSKPPKGLVITGPNEFMFTAGADIGAIRDITDPELATKLARHGQLLFDKIAKFPFPTVAAISGACVGGGCELALACDVRLISDTEGTVIGLPEVKLGIIPGFGGTQRLPRLIGLPKALDIILSGKTLRPKQALKVGLVNEILSFDQLLGRAERIAAGKESTRSKSTPFVDGLLTNFGLGRSMVRRQASATLKRKTKGFYPAPPKALDACIYGLENGIEAGLEYEAKELGNTLVTSESKSLVHLFFLTEDAKNIGKTAKEDVEHVHCVVVGAGTMGAGIAGILAKSKCQVILKDTTQEAVDRGVQHVRGYLEGLRYLKETDRSFILNRIEATSRESENTGNANFVIEAIFENLDVKKKVLADLAGVMPEDAIITTNTSSLSVTEIASAIPKSERVAGMHFFNPAEKMPLVEIIRGEKTSDRTIAVIAALASKLGKFPIVVNDVPGFLVNRILTPYLNEAGYLFLEGYAVSDIDKAAAKFGMPMGPIRLLDEIGLDVAVHVSDVMAAGYGERMKGPGSALKLVDAGRLGKKSGGGFYDFENGKETPSSEACRIVGVESSKTGDSTALAERMIMSLLNEAILCLDEGVAGIPGKEAACQIDLGTVMGTGFPPFRGGLIYYAEKLGAQKVLEKLESLEKLHGERFRPVEGIKRRAESGKSFYESC